MRRSRTLAAAVVLLTVVVLGLGAAAVVVRVREPGSESTAEKEVVAWEGTVRADPRDDWAQVGLGLALLTADRGAEALAAFERAVDLNGENWLALFQLGLLVREDAPSRAESLLQRAAKFAPRRSRAGPLVALGDLRLAGENARGAQTAYRKAVADVPFLVDARLGLARALEQLGEPDRALQQYREAARYDPANREAAEAIARLAEGG